MRNAAIEWGTSLRCVHKVRCLGMTSTTRDRKIRRDRFMTVPVSKVLPAYHQREHACQYAEVGISFWREEIAKSCRACLARKPE
jgi:hypothetical protein